MRFKQHFQHTAFCKDSQYRRLIPPLFSAINTRLIALNKAISATCIGIADGNMLRGGVMSSQKSSLVLLVSQPPS